MSNKRKITDAREDSKGNISHVQFKGNANFTPVKAAIKLAKEGKIENAHVSHTKTGKEYLRTNPDQTTGNNLDEMASD